MRGSKPKSLSTAANERPWTRPKPPAMRISLPRKIGRSAWIAETKMESAIAASMGACGTWTRPSAPSTRVSEWPTVKAVTTLAMRRKATRPPA